MAAASQTVEQKVSKCQPIRPYSQEDTRQHLNTCFAICLFLQISSASASNLQENVCECWDVCMCVCVCVCWRECIRNGNACCNINLYSPLLEVIELSLAAIILPSEASLRLPPVAELLAHQQGLGLTDVAQAVNEMLTEVLG